MPLSKRMPKSLRGFGRMTEREQLATSLGVTAETLDVAVGHRDPEAVATGHGLNGFLADRPSEP